MNKKILCNLAGILFLSSLGLKAASIHAPFIDGQQISSSALNLRFNEVKTKLLEKEVSISLDSFNSKEPITAAKINQNIAVLRAQGATITDIQANTVIKASDINTMFSSLNAFIDNSLIILSPNTSANYNIFNATGNRTDKVKVVINIKAGVDLYSTNVSVPALSTGSGWHSGSTIEIVNNGRILGMGGAGAQGGYSGPQNQWVAGYQGQSGGDAIQLFFPVKITNNNVIFGGGGGGGTAASFHGKNVAACGGGGGGGQGYGYANGGPLGSCVYQTGQTAGGAGTINGPGGGGNQGVSYIFVSGSGGRGGYWGEDGAGSAWSTSQHTWGNVAPTPGGAAGAAIRGNGYSVNWVSGNNGTQVKGPQY